MLATISKECWIKAWFTGIKIAMKLFSAATESSPGKALGTCTKLTVTAVLALLWGCSPILQKAPVPPQETSLEELADLLGDSRDITQFKIVEEDLELSAKEDLELTIDNDSELEPLAVEEIPLPNPDETLSLENDDDVGNKERQVDKSEIAYDFPVVLNSHVEFFLDKFQNSQHETFRKWLERSGRYLPLIQEELQKADMPLDLAYLPMIESGYRLTAYSTAKAVGPWQFMPRTALSYNLTINNYVDDRRDPIRSTRAAISFLADLYREFNSWPLAVAAYNAGGGKIRRAIKKTGSRDFWQLIKGSHLKTETKYYVPKLIAAIMIAKDPASYGFTDIAYDEPLAFETLEVPRWTTIQAIALAADADPEDIHNLNRQLRRAITPPGKARYSIRVPTGKKELTAGNLPRVKATVSTSYKTHVIKKSDTVTRICKKYNINKKTLLKANNLRSNELVAGKRLRIPYRATSYKLMAEGVISAGLAPAAMRAENLIIHVIKPGETISQLASRYNVPPRMIAAWNGLDNLDRIRAGQQLAFYLQDADDPIAGEISMASRKTGRETDRSDPAANPRPTYYSVIGGDTLWTIARKFQTTPEKIRLWNNIEGDTIYPGHRLLLKTSADLDA
jgi:membrane-bound lytic murein transglycosylase D